MLSLKLTTPTHTHKKEKSYTSKITDRLTQDTNQSLLGVCFALGPHSSQPFPGLDPLHKTSLYQKSFEQMLNGASESEVKAQVL